jgi:hypothetical protein
MRWTGTQRMLRQKPLELQTLRVLASLVLAAISAVAAAQDAGEDARKYVQFVEDHAAMCVSRNSVEILVKNTHRSRTVRVWLDRYNGGVPTADRSRTELKPGAELKFVVGYSAFQNSLPLTDTHFETPDCAGEPVLPSVTALALTASLVHCATTATTR